ncbi:MAG: O-methyltransferase [Eubacterium sp.]|nr:O-methyltransferase [Eubacterium sp.]
MRRIFVDERMEVFLELYRKQPSEEIRDLEERAKRDQVPIIRRGTRDLIGYLLRTNKPKQVLEVGTAVGYSALYMLENLPENSGITTVEKVPMRLTEAKKNFARLDPEGRINLREGDATEVLKDLVEEGKKFDFIFMDAAKGQYLNFLPNVLELLEEGGLLVTDNILHEGDILESRYAVTRRDRTIHSRMRDYLKALTDHPKLETICLPLGDGMTLSRKMED